MQKSMQIYSKVCQEEGLMVQLHSQAICLCIEWLLEDEIKRTKTMVYIQICSIDIYLEVMQMSQADGLENSGKIHLIMCENWHIVLNIDKSN